MLKKMYGLTALFVTIFFSSQVNATVVQFQTVLGPFEINLYDESTLATVANFLDLCVITQLKIRLMVWK